MRSQGGSFSRGDWLKIWIIAVVVVIDALWIVLAGYSFDASSTIRPFIVVLFLLAVAEFYRHCDKIRVRTPTTAR